MSPSPIRISDLQNGHPTPCGDLYGTNDDHIIAGNSTAPHLPKRIASGCPSAMLHRHKGIRIEYDAKLETGSHREKSINYACDQLREPFQRDLVAVPCLIPYLNLPFPWLIARPLEGWVETT